MSRHTLCITEEGELRALYSDDLRPYFGTPGTDCSVSRASNVEPDEGGWVVLYPDRNEKMLSGLYDERQTALQAEVEYLTPRLAEL